MRYNALMKTVLDIKTRKDPAEGDVIVWKGGCWEAVSKESLFASHITSNAASFSEGKEALSALSAHVDDVESGLKAEIEKLQKSLVELAKAVKEK